MFRTKAYAEIMAIVNDIRFRSVITVRDHESLIVPTASGERSLVQAIALASSLGLAIRRLKVYGVV